MNGKSNVFHYLNKHKDEKILVLADGAAFGSEIDRVLQLIERRKNVALYLPESFEWMILSAGILKNSQVENIVNNPAEFVESREYFSWERFFTALLTGQTQHDPVWAYSKRKLAKAYVSSKVMSAVKKVMNLIDWN